MDMTYRIIAGIAVVASWGWLAGWALIFRFVNVKGVMVEDVASDDTDGC
jgi:hypothetical protein